MKEIHLITVGKLNDSKIEYLENDYFKRINSPKLCLYEAKSHSENLEKESKEVCLKLDELHKSGPLFIVILTEKGQQFTSKNFSSWLNKLSEKLKIVFIIGGASGHGPLVIKRANFELSLSEFTFPHKIARLLLVEQIYRAQTIKQNHPYHK